MSDKPSDANDVCVGPKSEKAGQASSCDGCPNQSACSSGQFAQENPALNEVKERLADIKHKILVLSGKGGVGKSTIASQIAWSLSEHDSSVGVLDIDICGPSIPRMMGVENRNVTRSNYGWEPVFLEEADIGVMSVGFMLSSRNDAVVWRGPRKDGLIRQFLTDTNWGDLDYLIVDAPPGTSDEHLSITSYLEKTPVDGAIIVTTPQEVSLLDVRKVITFCRQVNLPILGVVENMAGFICPCCKTKSDIFVPVTGGAEGMCKEMNVPFLGSIPLDPILLKSCEAGHSYVKNHPNAPSVDAFNNMINNLIKAVSSK